MLSDIPTSLLFSGSPLLGFFVLFSLFISVYIHYTPCIIFFSVLLFLLLLFYRNYECSVNYSDNVVVSPADGVIQYIEDYPDYFCIGIFLGVHNIHTQVYPVNGKVVERYYDETGKFDLVVDGTKGRDNEKKIHTIKTRKGTNVVVSQIAGFLPRRIASDDAVRNHVKAGQYLGIIKFGSRVDLKIQKPFTLSPVFRINSRVYIGDILGTI